MKKVAIVAQGLGDGGAERVASILANGLSKYYTVLFVAAYSSDKERSTNYLFLENRPCKSFKTTYKRNNVFVFV